MTRFINRRSKHFAVIGVLFLVVLSAALLTARTTRTASTKPSAPPPPDVSVINVTGEDVSVYREYAARTYARDLVEVRGRVDGYIERRTFDIGADVKAGQVLYVLDLRPYEAEAERARGAFAQATADLAQAEANLVKAKQDVERLTPLVKDEAAAKQDLDNALVALRAGEATVESRKATVEAARAVVRTAELNVEYATIRAPLSGRIGDSLLQVGGLVSHTAAQPLTTIVPLDPIWVRFQISEAELLAFQQLNLRSLPARLVMSDGSVYSHPGRIENTLNGVNARTGTMEVQASFPNPDHVVLPGQFGRMRLGIADRKNALLVPQKAIQELQGQQTVFTVGANHTVQVRSVQTGDRVDGRWMVERGLEPGDSVIVEGVQKVRPGAIVSPRPYSGSARSTAAATRANNNGR